MGVPVALNAVPAQSPAAQPYAIHPQISFTVTVNGQSGVLSKEGPQPSFTVTPGERLTIRIGVHVQARARVTALWVGVVKGSVSSPGIEGQQPAGMRPVFAHASRLLTPAATWSVPAQLPAGTTLGISAAWVKANDWSKG